MTLKSIYITFGALLVSSTLISTACAQNLTVLASGGFYAPFEKLAPGFEISTGAHITPVHGASMGSTPTAIPNRLARNEPADVVIMSRPDLDLLAKKGLVVEGSQVDLVRSKIGMAVKTGAPVPDIRTVAAFRLTLLAAKSIAYSDSASGVYIASEMYKKMGIEDQVGPKSKRILGDPVGTVVAKGEAEIGFQQMSELKPIAGITVVGTIPEEVQKVTMFAAGVVTTSEHKDKAKALIQFLAARAACPVIEQSALEPVACAEQKK